LLENSDKNVTAITRQRLLYYCLPVGKSKCFSLLSILKKKKVHDITLLCVCILPIVARQRLGKYFPAATNTLATLEELLAPSFSMQCVSCQSRRLDLPRTSCFLISFYWLSPPPYLAVLPRHHIESMVGLINVE
jgi:hypothetical protein